MAIDTLAISGKLRAAGFTESQAAAQVEALQEATEDLVTESGLREFEARLDARLAQMEVRMTRYILFAIAGSMTALTAIFAFIVKLT